MRVLRTSCYADMTPDPLTTVVRDCDVVDTLESIQHYVMVPDAFFVFDIFEMPEGTDIEEATAEAKQRIEAQRDYNMCVLYFWTIRQYRNMVEVTGNGKVVVMCQDPAPLNVDDVEAAFKQLSLVPDFKGIAICRSHDGIAVTLEDGDTSRA